MRFFKIEEQEIGVVPGKDCVLWTEGLSTCICILVRGTIDRKSYLAMFHWDGFPCHLDRCAPNLASQLEGIVLRIFDALKLEIKRKMSSLKKPVMTSCICIGGEKRSESLSGTELEVDALNTYGMTACKRYFKVKKGATFLSHNFLTTGSVSLRVVFSFERLYCCDDSVPFEESNDTEQLECGVSSRIYHV